MKQNLAKQAAPEEPSAEPSEEALVDVARFLALLLNLRAARDVARIRSRPRPRHTGGISLTAVERRRVRERGLDPDEYVVGAYVGTREDGSRYETRVIEHKRTAELVRRRQHAEWQHAARRPLRPPTRHARSAQRPATRAPRAPRARRRVAPSSPSGSSRSGDDGDPIDGGGRRCPLTRAEARRAVDDLRQVVWSLRYDLEEGDPGRVRLLERVEEIESAAEDLLSGLGSAA